MWPVREVDRPGIAGITGFFGNVGIPAPAVMAPLLMGFEVVGGLLLIVGLFSRFVGAAMIVEFLVAGLVVSLPLTGGWKLGADRLPAAARAARCSCWPGRACYRWTPGSPAAAASASEV